MSGERKAMFTSPFIVQSSVFSCSLAAALPDEFLSILRECYPVVLRVRTIEAPRMPTVFLSPASDPS